MHTTSLRHLGRAVAAMAALALCLPLAPSAVAQPTPTALDDCISESLQTTGESSLAELTTLECPNTLSSRGREITSLAPLVGAEKLKTIELNGPLGLTDLTTLPSLPVLQILSITHAGLTSLEGISNVPTAESLDFSYNSITDVKLLSTLPQEQLKTISSLDLVGNPIPNDGVKPGIFRNWLTHIGETYISDQTGLGPNTSGIGIITPVTIPFAPVQGQTYQVENITYKTYRGIATSSYTSVDGDTLPHFSITHNRETSVMEWTCDAGCDQIRPGLPYKVAEIKMKVGRMGGFDYVQVAQVNFTFETPDRANLTAALAEARKQQAHFTTNALDSAITDSTQLARTYGSIKDMQDAVERLTDETRSAHQQEPQPAPQPTPIPTPDATPAPSSNFPGGAVLFLLAALVFSILQSLGFVLI